MHLGCFKTAGLVICNSCVSFHGLFPQKQGAYVVTRALFSALVLESLVFKVMMN